MARKALSPLLLFICTPTTINNTGHPVDERRNGVLVVCWPSLGLLLVGTVSGTFYTNLSATITTAVLPEYNLPPNLSMALDENAAYFLSGVLRVLRTTRYNTCQKYTTPIHHIPICRQMLLPRHHRYFSFFFVFFLTLPTSQLLLDKPWSQVSSLLPPRLLPSIFTAHRVQQSHCSSIFL